MNKQKNQCLLIFLLAILCFACKNVNNKTNAYQKWHKVSLDFEGPATDENEADNPFLNYRLNVLFKNGDRQYLVPGFYAADGNAAESSSTAGNIWRVNFSPDKTGVWSYEASFRKGDNIAVSNDPTAGEGVAFDGVKGQFEVIASDKTGRDFRHTGRPLFEEGHYLKYADAEGYFLKAGADSPENLLAFADFDGTYSYDSTKQFVKTYEPHLKDWNYRDPAWQDGKGKGLIGALNYIASKGMNAVYFLTMNIEGDGRDVWPYISHEEFTRFDCSKLDQWEIVFAHMDSLGIMLHMVTQETENELLLDNGDTGLLRKLYYRELIARFSHHLAITWNLGEENGPADFTPKGQNDQQRKDMASFIKETDPYDHFLVVHTHAYTGYKDSILAPLLGFKDLDGLSMQVDDRTVVHQEILKWLEQSKQAKHQWTICLDEIGMYYMGVMPDAINPNHDTIRQEVLWGSLMAGAGGVEWYFGYLYPPADLDCEDWRSRDAMWNQTRYAVDFFYAHLPFQEMTSQDELLDTKQAYCFAKPGEVYAVYLKDGNAAKLDLSAVQGSFQLSWYNPRRGGKLSDGVTVEANGSLALNPTTTGPGQDWVALLKKK